MKILTSNIIFACSGQPDNWAKTGFWIWEEKINAEQAEGVTFLEKMELTRLTFQIWMFEFFTNCNIFALIDFIITSWTSNTAFKNLPQSLDSLWNFQNVKY